MCANIVLLQVDGVTRYVDWAASHNFGIMDINVPRSPEVRNSLDLLKKKKKKKKREFEC